MKTKKIIALMLSMAMVLGVVAACSKDDDEDETTAAPATDATESETEPAETDDTEPVETETEPVETETEAPESEFFEKTIAEVEDEGDKVLIYGWNEEFPGLVTKYWGDNYDLETTESNTYQTKLDQVLASGEDAPDIFVCDADYARKYMNSDNTIAINDIGIAYSELTEMYNYTLQFAADDNDVIKGLAWQACPCGVFYNRTLANTYLGVSEPEDVQQYFESWDAFIETARSVNEASEGKVKVVSGTDEIWRAILNTRTSGWIVNGEVVVDPIMMDYFDMAKILYDEGLTFEAGQWSDAWTANMSNSSVLSYWGPMWLLNFCMGFPDNPTTGDWGLVKAPGDFFWGGTWMMASKYCDMKASVAEIMRSVALDEANLRDMTTTGEFVNSVAIMTDLASDPTYSVEYLAGQNPAAVLLAAAQGIDNSTVGENDQAINDEFNNVVNSYLAGDIDSPAAAVEVFTQNVEAMGIL